MFENKLRFLREQLGIPQKDFAKRLGISQSRYCNYESEVDIIPIKHLSKISDYYNVSFDYLFGFSNEEQYENNHKGINQKLSGKRIMQLRKIKGLTQTAFASEFDCTYGAISGYERGRYPIATKHLYDLCKKYNISADYLLGKIDTPKYL